MACKNYDVFVNSKRLSFSERFVTPSDLLDSIGLSSGNVEQVFSGGNRLVLSSGVEIDLGAPGVEKFEVYSDSNSFFFKVNGELRVFGRPSLKADEVIERGGMFPSKDFVLVEKMNGSDKSIPFDSNEKIDLTVGAVREFGTFPRDKVYLFKVDKQRIFSPDASLTGSEILTKAGLIPASEYELIQKFCGNRRERIELEDIVDLAEPGIEKFVSIPLDQREGGVL